MGYFDQKENSPGKLVNEMNMKTSTINDAVLSLLSSLIQCCGDFVSATIIGFIYSWKMTLINTCFIPVIFVINYVHSSYLSSIEKKSLNNNFGNIMSETLCNITTVFSFNCKNHMMNLFENEINKDLNNLYMKCFISGILQGLVNCVIFLDYGICFYFTGIDVINNQLTLENFLECYASIMTATFYIGTTVNSVKNLSLMRQSIKEIINLLETKSEINPFETKSNLINIDREKLQGKIEFKDVVFSYPTNSKKIVLNKINISIQPGEKICFIGPSGSGKSTIGQLIERFYDINEGEILIDDIGIKNYNLVSLRKNISYVSQEPVLFVDSIINNIKYGNSTLKYEEIKEYSQMCKIDDKLNINNNFSELSGGQKQRIAIIRAILKKAKILILDEATSALDNETENEVKNIIYNYIENNGITTIVISHKITSFERFNRVFKIDNGEMFEIKNVQ
jgi:ABC-type multidrug transport system fused ATPase/permease subunit